MSVSAPQEPAASAFFACPNGVAVYVPVRQRSVRVEFTSVDADGKTDSEDELATSAVLLARAAFRKHRDALASLFQVVESERSDPKQS